MLSKKINMYIYRQVFKHNYAKDAHAHKAMGFAVEALDFEHACV